MLGAYGSGRTNGMDIIRLIWWNPAGERLFWRSPPPFAEDSFYLGYEYFDDGFDEPGGLPEVFGGGDEWNGPSWPYNKSEEHMDQFIYGAPDGVEDGIILVLTNGSEVMAYFQ